MRTPTGKRVLALASALLLMFLCGLGLAPRAQAVNPDPVQYFYVPFPEDQLLQAMQAVELGGAGATPANPMTSYITISAVGSDTLVYYDQWENGYDIDIANPVNIYSATNLGGTQIWGDGDTANGAPPGVPSDIVNAGTVISLNNQLNSTTLQSVIDFDGRDKIAVTKTVALTRSGWASGSNTLLAGSVEVFGTNNWGTDYRAPVGANIPDGTDYQVFEYTGLAIMAGEGGATVQIDADANGAFETTVTLVEGQSHLVNGGVSVGGHVVSNNPVQVDVFTGDIGSNYESRDSALLPTDSWSSSYYTPVSTPNTAQGNTGTATTAWLYNPGAGSITVTYERWVAGVLTTSTITVPAGGYAKQVLQDTSGARFYSSGAPFYAFSTTDSNSATYANNQAWDWGFSLIPRGTLTTQVLVGLGIGRDPISGTNPYENGNPVWVTPVGNGSTATTVYVDYDADPTTGPLVDPNGSRYDTSYSLRELDQARVYGGASLDATSAAGTPAQATPPQTLTFAHTTGTRADRLMVVGVAIRNEDGSAQRTVASVTYGGQSLTFQGAVSANTGGAEPRTEIWALANPPSGTQNVVVTLNNNGRAFVAGTTTYSGVNLSGGLTSALGAVASASGGTGATKSVTVNTTTGGFLVYDIVATGGGTDPGVFTPGAGQTQWLNGYALETDTARHLRAASSTEMAAALTTTMSSTSATGYPWAISAVPIRPNRAQSGMLLYTLDPNVKLAAAWGQDPLTASASAPGLDVGTSVPPMPEFTAGKDGTLYDNPGTPGVDGDLDGDGYISPGDQLLYKIDVYNIGRLPVPDVIVSDEVPADTAYVAGSTYNGATQIPDDAAPPAATAYPLDEGGVNVGTLPLGGSVSVTFRAAIDSFDNLTPGATQIFNGGSGYALGTSQPVSDRAPLRGRIGDFVWYDSDRDGVQDAGEAGIGGVTVRLLDSAGNPALDDLGNPVTDVTKANGSYDFKGLRAGSYIVEFVAPAGTSFTLQNADGLGITGTVNSDANATTGRTVSFALAAGEHIRYVDAGFYPTNPTQAVVSSFEAYVEKGKVVLGWGTASEVGTAGFNVERFDAKGDRWVIVNDGLVPALFESPSGGSYSLVDGGAHPNKTYTYRVVEFETAGTLLYHGPYEVTPEKSMPPGAAADDIGKGKKIARVPKVGKLDSSPVPPPPAGVVAMEAATPDRLRIEVTKAGLYRIDAADIAAWLGVSQEEAGRLIGDKQVRLTAQGRTVAYLRAEDGSALYFYGQSVDSIYTSTNAYWLTLGKGETMEFDKRDPASGAAMASFVDESHAESDLTPSAGLFHDPEADFWLWDYVVAGNVTLGAKSFALDAPDALNGIQLDVVLQGMTTVSRADEHHVEIRLNGFSLGDTRWTGKTRHRVSFAIPNGTLRAGANEVRVVGLLDSGVPYSVVALDSIDLSYERATRAVADQLSLKVPTARPVQVDGLSSADAWVFDLADPLIPRRLHPTGSGGDPGAAWLTFDSTAQGRDYLVATAAGAMRPVGISAVGVPRLKASGRGADYLVITAPTLYDAATRLADYRSGQGLATAVVTTSQIYDEFSDGRSTPHGIRAFIAYAVAQWDPAPRFVLLAGEGSYDYKNNLGYADSLVPPLMVDTKEGLAPSDVVLADVAGADGVPEVSIGRIPALTEAGLDAALAKIQAYESEPYVSSATWRQSVLLAADNPDGGGSFHADSDALAASLPSSLLVSKAYLGTMTLTQARAAVTAGFNRGTLWVNYVGHAGVDQLAQERLLGLPEVASLATGSRLPVVTALTCVAGQYGLPGHDGVSEALVKRAGSGAIAVWSPTALGLNPYSVRLGALFSGNLFGTSSDVILGDAVRGTLVAAAAEASPPSILLTYNLLGDPALRVRW